jgi:hypothetical protein
MKPIKTDAEMAHILIERQGYLLNDGPEARRVHHASCNAVAAMVASRFPRYFATDSVGAKQWLDDRFGPLGWVNCGYCNGLQFKSH